MASFGSIKSSIYDREERKQQYQAHVRGLNAFDRHKKFLHDYARYYGNEAPSNLAFPVKTDQDTIREGYRFIRTEEDDNDTSWEQRLVKRYYDKLFKEYCIADMSKYKTGKIGLRWRTEKEVVSGKGQFICGNKHCDENDGLASYEVNFSYSEAGESKQALVKLVACERCAEKLHYRRKKEKERLERTELDEQMRMGGTSKNDSGMDHDGKRRKDRKRKSSDLGGNRGKEDQESRRERTKSEELDDELSKKNKASKKRGRWDSNPVVRDNEDDEEVDEYFEGMFP